MPVVLIENSFDGVVNQCRRCQNASGHSFHDNVINDQFNLKLVDICFNNMLQILCKSQLCFAKI